MITHLIPNNFFQKYTLISLLALGTVAMAPETASATNPCDGFDMGTCVSGVRSFYRNGPITVSVKIRKTTTREFRDDGRVEEAQRQCAREQTEESDIDRLARQARDQIVLRGPSIEHATFIVDVGGTLELLTVISGTAGTTNLTPLYSQMNARGILDHQIRGVIHSHPPDPGLTGSSLADSRFLNGFPSQPDFNSFVDYSNNAALFGGSRTDFEASFRYYIVDSFGVLREYASFQLNTSLLPHLGGSYAIPSLGSSERNQLSRLLAIGEEDAKGGCGSAR